MFLWSHMFVIAHDQYSRDRMWPGHWEMMVELSVKGSSCWGERVSHGWEANQPQLILVPAFPVQPLMAFWKCWTEISLWAAVSGAIRKSAVSTLTTAPCCVFLYLNVTMLFLLRSKQVFCDTSCSASSLQTLCWWLWASVSTCWLTSCVVLWTWWVTSRVWRGMSPRATPWGTPPSSASETQGCPSSWFGPSVL